MKKTTLEMGLGMDEQTSTYNGRQISKIWVWDE